MTIPENPSNPENDTIAVMELLLDRKLTDEEISTQAYFHRTVDDIDYYLRLIEQYDFIEFIEQKERHIGGWEAAVRFPEGYVITFWQDIKW